MADFTVNKTDDRSMLSWPPGKTFVMKRTVDFSEAANYLVQNGIMAIFMIPANVKTREFGMRAITADAQVTTVQLGVYTRSGTDITAVDLDGFSEESTIAATGYVAMDVDAVFNPAGTAARGYIGEADYYLTIKNTDEDTINDAVVEFFAICEDCR